MSWSRVPKLAGKAAAPALKLDGKKITCAFTAIPFGFAEDQLVAVSGFGAAITPKKIIEIKIVEKATNEQYFELREAILANRGGE